MHVTVYLNEARGASFDGFNADEAELRIAVSFNDDEPENTPEAINRYLDKVWEQLNIGGSELLEATEYTTHYREEGNRSLSVGDLIVLVGHHVVGTYSVERTGFTSRTLSDRIRGTRRYNTQLLTELNGAR